MEGVLIPFIVFGFTALIVKMSLDYSKWKKMHRSGSGDVLETKESNSLTVSELRELIQDAVKTANAPLVERIARLEGHLESDRPLIEEKPAPRQLKAQASSRES